MDSKRPCNEINQTRKDLVVHILMYPAYVFLKSFIESLLTFRYLWFEVHFMHGVRESSNLILVFFVLVSLPGSFIVSVSNVYCQHQGRNIPFCPHFLNSLVFVKFLTRAILRAVRWFLPVVSFDLHFSYLGKLTSFPVLSFQGWIHVTS